MPILAILLSMLMLFQPSDPTRVRFLLRDENDTGVAGATLTLRTETGDILTVVTDANGVAVTGALPGRVFFLLGGQFANGKVLVADITPVSEGLRVGLIPGEMNNALLRFYDDKLVLDPDMIFSPNEPGEPPVPTPWQFAPTVPPLADETPLTSAVVPNAPVATVGTGAPDVPTAVAAISGMGAPDALASEAEASASVTEAAASRTALTILISVAAVGVVLIALALVFALHRRRHV